MNTNLNKRGYSIIKSEISNEEQLVHLLILIMELNLNHFLYIAKVIKKYIYQDIMDKKNMEYHLKLN